MIYAIRFDDTLDVIAEPEGLTNLSSLINRDKVFNTILYTQEVSLTFYKDGYNYILAKDENAFCDRIGVKIWQWCDGSSDTYTDAQLIFDGNIIVAHCEFDITFCSVKCKLEDNSFYAKVNNNKGLKAQINVAKSKNGQAITAGSPDAIDMFDPTDLIGVYDYHNRRVYSIMECLKFIIAYITDGELLVESTIFGAAGRYAGFGITMGKEIRLAGQTNFPAFSFNELYTEIKKKFNTGFYFTRSLAGVMTIHFERAEDMFIDIEMASMPNIDDLKRKVDQSQLYASVKVGTTTTDDAPALHFPETIRYFGFMQEQYGTLGTCNFDSELDLVTQWIVSSNIIEDVIVNNVDSYDDNIFWIEYHGPAVNQAIQNDIFNSGPPFQYNIGLSNAEVLKRWANFLPASIVAYLSNGTEEFTSDMSVEQTDIIPNNVATIKVLQFDNELTDPGNNYDPATFKYTAPSAQFYSFHLRVRLRYPDTGVLIVPYTYNIGIQRYNGANVLQQTILSPDLIVYTSGQINFMDFVFTVYLDSALGEYVKPIVQVYINTLFFPANLPLYTGEGGDFSVISTSNGGGQFTDQGPSLVKIDTYAFKYPVSLSTFNILRSDPRNKIRFATHNDKDYFGWIDNFKYDHDTEIAEIRLITSRDITSSEESSTNNELRETGDMELREIGDAEERE